MHKGSSLISFPHSTASKSAPNNRIKQFRGKRENSRGKMTRDTELGVLIDARSHIVWARQRHFKEVGLEWEKIVAACKSHNRKYLTSLPFVIRVLRPRRTKPLLRRRIPEAVRALVLSSGFCAYCGASEKLEVDHIRPISKHGTNRINNLQPLCRQCNSKKNNKILRGKNVRGISVISALL